MKAAVTVELDRATFVLDEGAYLALRSYLDRASARLGKHPDRADVLTGLERSIAAKLAAGPAAQGMPLDHGEMLAALKAVGRVDGPELEGAEAEGAELGLGPKPASGPGSSSAGAGRGPIPNPASGGGGPRFDRGPGPGPGPGGFRAGRHYERSRQRRLYRLREGQHVAGVCTGLAAFSEVDVNLIRLIFILGTMFSGGVLLVGYVILAFLMPLARTEAEIAEAHGGGLPAG